MKQDAVSNNQCLCARQEKELVLDGAMGKNLKILDAHASDRYRIQGSALIDYLNFSQTDLVTAEHTTFLEAGEDVIECNIYRSNHLVTAEHELADIAFVSVHTIAAIHLFHPQAKYFKIARDEAADE